MGAITIGAPNMYGISLNDVLVHVKVEVGKYRQLYVAPVVVSVLASVYDAPGKL